MHDSSQPPTLPASAPTRTSGLAVASLVLGVLSCPFSLLASIPGLICGIVGLTRISSSQSGGAGPRLTGRGMAITGIVLSGLVTISFPVLVALMLPAVQAAREAARRVVAMNDLKQVSLAMLMKEASLGGYPVDILDADGRPLLSWRVAILPFLGDEAKRLFAEFHLDEPWDSDHNKALIPRMPAVYAAAGTAPAQGLTGVLLPAGPGSFGQPEEAVRDGDAFVAVVRPASVTDGLSRTVFVMALPGVQVPWTQPADWVKEPTEMFALLRNDGVRSFAIGTGDGAVRTIRTDMPDDTVTAIFSRARGDVVPADAF